MPPVRALCPCCLYFNQSGRKNQGFGAVRVGVKTFGGKIHKRFQQKCDYGKNVQDIAGDMQNVAGMPDFIDEGLAAVV